MATPQDEKLNDLNIRYLINSCFAKNGCHQRQVNLQIGWESNLPRWRRRL